RERVFAHVGVDVELHVALALEAVVGLQRDVDFVADAVHGDERGGGVEVFERAGEITDHGCRAAGLPSCPGTLETWQPGNLICAASERRRACLPERFPS